MSAPSTDVPRRTAPRFRALAITGWGVLSPIGIGAAGFADAVRDGRGGLADVSAMFDEPLPRPEGFALVDFQAKAYLGRRGTSFLDRSTALALVACGQAIEAAGLVIDDSNTDRVGVVLGTTAGSTKSTSDFSRATFVEDRPYLVNPLIFPNAVMNAPAGQTAIRHQLRGVNATIAGDATAVLSALRYARGQITQGRADVLLVGAVEEFCPQSAWATEFAMREHGGELAAGEGAAVFVVEDAERVRARGVVPAGEILAVEVATHLPDDEGHPEPDFSATLSRCVTRALARAGVDPEQVWAVASAENGMPARDGFEDAAIVSVLGERPERIRIRSVAGEAASASGALQIAALLALHRGRPDRDGAISLITSRTPDGVVGAAVLRGCGGDDRGDG